MRILHWAHSLFSENGGLEEFVRSLSEGLRARGHSVAFVSEKPRQSEHPEGRAEWYPHHHLIDLEGVETGSSPAQTLSKVRQSLDSFVSEFRPDLIHLHSVGRGDMAFLVPLARTLSFPVIYTAHAPFDAPGHINHLHAIKDRVNAVIYPSEFMRSQGEIYMPVWDSLSRVIKNGVKVAPDRPDFSNPGTIFASGRHVADKGFQILIASLPIVRQTHPDATLVLAGSGPDTPILKNLSRVLGVDDMVSWPGWVTRQAASEYVSSSTVACVPSVWNEPFGLVAAEAAMAGTPVVASSVGGLSEIVLHGESGFLVSPGDIALLGIALTTILGDPELRHSMSQTAQDIARGHFSISTNIDLHETLYQELVHTTLPGAADD